MCIRGRLKCRISACVKYIIERTNAKQKPLQFQDHCQGPQQRFTFQSMDAETNWLLSPMKVIYATGCTCKKCQVLSVKRTFANINKLLLGSALPVSKSSADVRAVEPTPTIPGIRSNCVVDRSCACSISIPRRTNAGNSSAIPTLLPLQQSTPSTDTNYSHKRHSHRCC